MANNYTKDSKITTQEILNLKQKINNNYFKNIGKSQRIPYILHMRLCGWTLRKIADKYQLHRERIRQQEARGVEYIIIIREEAERYGCKDLPDVPLKISSFNP